MNAGDISTMGREERRLLLAELLAKRSARPRRFPLSFAQERLWFLEQMQPGGSAYHVGAALRIGGPLRPSLIEAALREVVRRHDTLRATFAANQGQAFQIVSPEVRLDLLAADLRALPETDRELETLRIAASVLGTPFDLGRGPLLRVALLLLSEDRWALLLVQHHIVSDGWSLAVLLGELAALYAAVAEGRPSPLPELSIQYSDYVEWQRDWLRGDVLAARLDYWREQLAGASALELPGDRPRPLFQTSRGGAVPFLFPPSLREQLLALSQSEGATPFMVQLAAFVIVLARHAGGEDVCLGSPIANRQRPELTRLIGFFANTLVLRIRLGGDPTFRETLARVRQMAVEAYEHQDIPFEKLVEALHPERDVSRTPLFQVAFAPQDATAAESVAIPGLEIAPFQAEHGTAKFDLTVEISDGSQGIRGFFEYNRDLFDRTTIVRLLGHLRALAEGAAARPESRLSELPLLSAAERHQLQREWNDTVVLRPAGALLHHLPVHRLIAAQAAVRPEAVAVSQGEEHLSYGELEIRSDLLARRLAGLGVGPEVLVGVAMERSPDLLVALLGIMKARGAYLPLDPAYPAERLAFMLDDSDTSVLLTQSRTAAALPRHSARVLLLDEGWEGEAAAGRRRAALAEDGALPGASAYVIYTSGSTGRPKGVQVSHGALTAFLAAMMREPGLDPGDTLLAVTSLSFDIAGLELFLPLLVGARVEPVPAAVASDGARLAARIGESGATVLQATPATWRMLLDTGWGMPGDLRLALTGGEALSGDLAVRLCRCAGEVWNLYGPTETTIWSTASRVEAGGDGISIGHPIANTRVYVLDGGMQPLPVRVPGELYVGGSGVARGYLRRPDLTAEKFVPDPWGGEPGQRLYRTGDLVRYQPGGALEFIGRLDHQVKVRGFRIELGEIETALREHPAVRQAVVTAREGRGGDRILVAYFVCGGEVPSNEQLRAFLRQRLPEYMVPSAFLSLEALPLTANGKVDRCALPAPERSPELAYEPPRGAVEETFARIWSEVLKLERVGIHDNFFDLGGHSILATVLMHRVREELGADLPLRTLFVTPTVAGLAAAVSAAQGEERALPARLPRIVPDPAGQHLPFPLTDVQEAYWIGRSAEMELGSVATHVYFEIDTPGLDVDRFERALQLLIDRHGMLRAIVEADGRQRILAAVPPYVLGRLDLRAVTAEAAGEALAGVRERMSHQVLPSDRWPLFEIAVSLLPPHHEGETGVRLHVSLDLLIGDAWSLRLLARDLGRLYERPEAPLPELEISFRDYVLAEAALRETEAWQRALEYWRGRLADFPPPPALALARSPSAVAAPRFVRRRGELAAASWTRLKERAARAGLTPSGALLAAWSEVLAAWGGGSRFTLNLTLFNRLPLHPQVDQLVGDFTSLTLLAVERRPGEPFVEGARRLQQRLWDDLDHRLVSGVRVLRELSRTRGEPRMIMPVVFTSTLNQAPSEPAATARSGVRAKGGWGISQTPQVWLDHQVSETGGALTWRWDAVEELFPAGMLDDMLAAYARLLERLAADEAAWREPVRGLLPAEQLRLIAEANATAAPAPAGLLHDPFLEQARRTPGAPAVITSGRTLTYGELDRLSLALAHRLRRLGAGPNRLVAVVMHKGWEQVAAVLAVLRAGAAYLPVDARLPAERLRHLLLRGETAVALTQAGLEGATLPWPEGVERVVVAEDSKDIKDEKDIEEGQDGQENASPDDLAYVIFTSGSTGEPKGVMIDHRGALNTVIDVNRRFGVGPDDRVLALSSLSFDLSVWDVFGVLAAGGAVVVPDPGSERDPAHWAELAARERVTVWNTVPALLEMLVEHGAGRPGVLAAPLRLVLLSGDWIPLRLPDRVRAAFPGAQVISLGGATEASIWSILHPVGEVGAEWTSIPYGRAMANQSFHVLDEDLEPCPVWVPGHLYIGGIGLARGYWRDEEKTRAAFLVHPRSGERLYRTGDLGRLLPSGDIEILGRDDTQVKVQGHRIELGEIEAALASHPAVSAAVVAAVGERNGPKRLVGYVVPQPAAVISTGAATPARAARLTHPIERLRFKLAHHGVRPDDGRPAVALQRPELPPEQIEALYLRRRTFRSFLSEPVPLDDVAALLAALLPVEIAGAPFPKHRYGSAGSLYPVQTWLHVKAGRVDGLAGGVYYHDPRQHRLVLVSSEDRLDAALWDPTNRAVFEGAAFAVFLIARLAAVAPLYGERARHFATLEAGLMTQLLETAAPAHCIGLAQMGGLRFDAVRQRFALDDSCELVHTLLGGRIDAAQTGVVAFVAEMAEQQALVHLLEEHPEDIAAVAASPAPCSDADLFTALREHLRSRLPEPMVPALWVRLPALPLSANGKVDRKALPAPETVHVEARPAAVRAAPETAIERVLADIWSELLRVERVGLDDDFFSLGGHSILATRLMRRVRDTFGVDLPLRTLFAAPTLAGLAAAVAARRRERGEQGALPTTLLQIAPDPEGQHLPFPLTDVQEAYWIGRSAGMELGSVATHVYFEIDTSGLDVDRFERALQLLIDRHGMLRAIVQPDGTQRILAAVPPYVLGRLDLRAVTTEAAGEALATVRERMSHQILPSDRWPLFEIAVSLLPPNQEREKTGVRLHVSLDLLIGDAWSLRLLARDLGRLYERPETPLPELEISFRDYVLAEAALRETEAWQRALEYWRGRLADFPPPPALPLARSPATIAAPRFVRRRGRLSPEAWERLKERAARAGLTPSGALLAAWSEVLAAWGGGSRFTLNLTLFNRLPLHPQVDQLVGDFTSLTLLAVERRPGEPFVEGARRLQQRLWDDLDHRLVSGVRVLRELSRARGGPRVIMPVVFTSTLNQAPSKPAATASDVRAEGGWGISQTPQVWLDHQITETDGALAWSWDAVEELFPAGLLDDMLGAYTRLLERLAGLEGDDEAAWREPVRGLVPTEQLDLIAAANATVAPLPPGLLHEPFLEQARRAPGAPAVITTSHTLTYGELDRLSLALAHRLRRLGAGPNRLVAVVMHKGWEQVAAVLAILRAGAAYLPVDARLPAERLRHLLARGEVAVALTQGGASLPLPEGIERVVVGAQDSHQDEGDFKDGKDEELENRAAASDLAYVIFTSGSTGEPKGVMIDHRGALNTVIDVNRRFRVGPDDRVLALSSLSFDLSVWDIFGVLAAGGALVVPDAGSERDPEQWAELAARERVTVWNTVPALMEMLVEHGTGRPEALTAPLRLVLLSGDWIPVRLPDRIRAAFPGARVISLGGATEASIWSILFPVGEVGAEQTSIPYGRAMANQSFHVLDDDLEPCPVWVPGHLWIGGVGLAQGYWRDEEKTRAAFLVHPRTGERLYRTGDLGRLLPSGDIEFLGRDDTQVKVQGYRIELGEIEAALARHPEVSAAVVAAVGERSGPKQLVAYVVPRPDAGVPAQAAVLTDPMERLRFKLAHPGLREDDGRPAVALRRPELAPEQVEALYLRRRSFRSFLAEPVPLDDLAGLLAALLPAEIAGAPFPKHRYGSAGNLYPVQTWLYVKAGRVEGLAGGVYYHDPLRHRLVLVSSEDHLDATLWDPTNRAVFAEAAFTVFLVARLAAIAPLYGERARHFAVLEAGLMTQLLETAAPDHRIGLSQMGGVRFEAVRQRFALDESCELVHTLLGGRLNAAQTGLAAFLAEVAEQQALVRLVKERPEGIVAAAPPFPSTPRSDTDLFTALREHLRSRLPEPMVPALWVRLDELPLSANGKVDRKALPRPENVRAKAQPAVVYSAPETAIERVLAGITAEVLKVPRVGLHDNFFDLGASSVDIVRVHAALRERLGSQIPAEISIVDMFNHPSVSLLARRLAQLGPAAEPSEETAPDPGAERSERLREAKDWRRQRLEKRRAAGDVIAMHERNGSEVAVTGLGLRFPGADSPEQLWENLRNGIESIRFFTDDELLAAQVNPARLSHPAYVKARPVLDGIDLFDADLFGIPPREARLLDPQHRIFLECAWEALERAGCDSESYSGLIGVYAGTDMNTYLLNYLANQALIEEAGALQVELASEKEYLVTRVSYKLDLHGPSFAVQAACSTSLVAVHLACQGLLAGDCDMALAGGASVSVPQIAGYFAADGSMLSPDGHCRAFDARAQGTVFGSGVGVVVLKRLADALEDGDFVHAVIKGSAVNNDGSRKVGYTAPGSDGQVRVVRAAQRMAEVDPETITYMEAHGTATSLGDPIEVAALTQAFRASTARKGFCAMGSIKTNLGHLRSAAGVAGLIKAVLALEHQELPPSLHLERPNPHIDFANSPFFVNDRLREWRPAEGAPRRAAVSSFGIGGTNAHVILEEAPPQEPSGPARPWQLLPLSAASASALERVRSRLADHLRERSDLALADAAWTLQIGRRAGRHRAFVVSADLADAAAALESPERVQTAFQELRDRPVAFLFPGQGAQHPGMARGLYESEPAFRARLDRCCEILHPLLGLDLRAALFPAADEEERAAHRLAQTELAQPALFAVEHSLACLWMEWGVRPRAMLGHSLGEYVAACLAGVFSLEDALALVAERGRLMQALPSGAMLSVPLHEQELRPRLGDGLSLAAVNGPDRCVVSGEERAVAMLEAELAGQGIAVRRLHTSHAFHSAAMDPVLAPFAELVCNVRREAPAIPFLSNLTGTWITAEQATDPEYWSRHLRETVRFGDGLRTLTEDEKAVLLEVGPGQTLAAFARQSTRSDRQTIVGSLPHPKDSRSAAEHLMDTVGRLWLAGAPVDWPAMHTHERRRRVELPTYPFERKRYWADSGMDSAGEGSARGARSSRAAARRELSDWFQVSSWKPSIPPEEPTDAGGRWLLLTPGDGLGRAVERRLAALGGTVVTVEPGESFAEMAPGRFMLRPGDREGTAALFARLHETGALPERVLHLWGLGEQGEDGEDRCFWSLLWLGQELGRLGLPGIQLRVVTDGLQSVSGEPVVSPEKALALGPVRVLPLEHPEICSAAIDVVIPKGEMARERLADLLIAEALAPAAAAEPVVAWRGEERRVEAFESVRIAAAGRLPFPQRGVCLVTGGLGGIGLTLARDLAKSSSARLVLIGRSAPERGHAAVRELEELGAEVLVLAADVTDEAAMRAVVQRTRERFGPIQAVIHAAGVPGAGVIQLKTAEVAARVLAPKVRGTRVLAAALAGEPLELLVLCSSIYAVIGGVGQVDYCAANSFLDAFARQAAQSGLRAVSLGWDAWQEVGMAVKAADAQQTMELPLSPEPQETGEASLIHPLLDRRLDTDGVVYATDLSPARHWILAEHRLWGTPAIPVTAWLEMARAAFAHATGAEAVEVRDVVFVSPLLVEESGRCEVRIVLEPNGEGAVFRGISRAGDHWQEHAHGSLRRLAGGPPAARDLPALAARCNVRRWEWNGDTPVIGTGEKRFSRGPRWQSPRRADLGDGEALVALELPGRYARDLEAFTLHPALLDVATALGDNLLTGGNAMPHSYGRVAVHGPLPSRLLAHIRANGEPDPDAATVALDVTLMDERGNVQVEVEGFAMKRIMERGGKSGPPSRSAEWIRPEEGVEAFRRALSRGRFCQIAIAPTDVGTAIEAVRRKAAAQEAAPARSSSTFERPSLATAYVAPSTHTETALAEIWQRILGLDRIGIHDNFFDLGGDSVVAVQVIAQGTKRGLPLTPEQLFQRQTIAALARLLEEAPAAAPAEPPAEPVLSLADYPEADLSRESLERLLARLEETH